MERFRILLDASGLRRADRRLVAEAVVPNHDWTYAIVTEAAAAGHEGFADHWHAVAEDGVIGLDRGMKLHVWSLAELA